MKLSLLARVALGLTAQMVLFGASIGFLLFSSDDIFERLSVLKDELEPAIEDMRTLLVELKNVEDNLASLKQPYIERIRGQIPYLRPFDRIQSDVAALKRTMENETVTDAALSDLKTAVSVLTDLIEGNRIVSGAMKTGAFANGLPPSNRRLYEEAVARFDSAAASGYDAELMAYGRELLREVRLIRGAVLKATASAVAAMREMNQNLFQKRSDMSLALVAVPAGTLVAALLLMLLTLRALKPVGELTAAVHRLSRGDYTTAIPSRLTMEFEDLASALESLRSELKRREEEGAKSRDELMKAERLAVVGRMASVVAHEVRNPLNSIALNVDMLADMLSQHGATKEVEILGAIQREIDRLSEITEEYLRFGRLPKASLVSCDAVRIVRDTLEFMASEFQAACIRVQLSVPDTSTLVRTDESQLKQALLNILRNAVEAMPEGGVITVEVWQMDRHVFISVTDTGCGIPESFRERLFEPFATTKPKGTGLGLAFVQQVMHESGGEVTIESEVGRGTTVCLKLPVGKEV